MGDYEKMQDYARRILNTDLEDIFPVLRDIREVEASGREFNPKKDQKSRTWSYEPLLHARVFYGRLLELHKNLKGQEEADALKEKVEQHLSKLNKKWDEVGIFKRPETNGTTSEIGHRS
jgi:hypothetical protein